jgi:hypothetical protein
MKRSPWLAALLAAPVALAAGAARAQDPPPDVPPLPPVQPVQPAQPAQPIQPAPYVQPVQPVQPAPYAQPAYAQPAPYFAPPPTPYWPPRGYVANAPEEDEHRGPANWYGWQTLVTIAPLDIMMFAGLSQIGNTGGAGTFAAAFAGRNLAPAFVHLAHGRVATAFGSVGLHIATTATGFAIGYGLGIAAQGTCKAPSPCGHEITEVPGGAYYGAIAGSMSGTVLDVVFFAYRQRLSWTAKAPAAPAGPAWAFAPYATPKGAGVAAAGMF